MAREYEVTLKEAKEGYYFNSGKSSDINRQICFAGIAIAWLFRSKEKGHIEFDVLLSTPIILFVVSLFLDILQYMYSSLAWDIFCNSKQKEGKTDDDKVTVNPSINHPSLTLFWLKHIVTISAYVILFIFLSDRLF